jgi:PKD repeat protein
VIFCFRTITYSFAQPNANFTASIAEGCSPLLVQFTDLSTGSPTSWLWDFGNGQSLTAKNPLITYSSPGTYSVSLIVKNASGTDDTVKTNYIVVDTVPQAQFISTSSAGCIPFVDTFTDQSIAGAGAITSWLWNFGDGFTSTANNATHTYTAGGTYTVTLTVQNSKGCRNTLVVDTFIHTGTKPTAAFTYPVLYTCASDPVEFKDKSTGTITSWLWTFGDGDSSIKKNPLHYFQDTGYLKIILRVINNGCIDSFETKNLYVKSPIAKLHSIISCDSPYVRKFVAKYLGPKSFHWDFGDGTTSTDKYPMHTYADTGQYVLKLFSFGTECNYVDSGIVTIVDEHPSFTYSSNRSSLCKYDTVKFVAANYNPANLASFAWDFGDGDSTAGSISNTSSHA